MKRLVVFIFLCVVSYTFGAEFSTYAPNKPAQKIEVWDPSAMQNLGITVPIPATYKKYDLVKILIYTETMYGGNYRRVWNITKENFNKYIKNGSYKFIEKSNYKSGTFLSYGFKVVVQGKRIKGHRAENGKVVKVYGNGTNLFVSRVVKVKTAGKLAEVAQIHYYNKENSFNKDRQNARIDMTIDSTYEILVGHKIYKDNKYVLQLYPVKLQVKDNAVSFLSYVPTISHTSDTLNVKKAISYEGQSIKCFAFSLKLGTEKKANVTFPSIIDIENQRRTARSKSYGHITGDPVLDAPKAEAAQKKNSSNTSDSSDTDKKTTSKKKQGSKLRKRLKSFL